MKIDSTSKEFQEYVRSIGYGNNDPRCNAKSPQFDGEFDNEAAQVALNDGCYMDASGNFVTLDEAVKFNQETNGGLLRGIGSGFTLYFLAGLLILVLMQCSCMSATLPVEPAPASLVVKGVNTPAVIPTQAESIREVCLTADTVYMRTGAGTGYEVVTVLLAGDVVTVTGGFVQSPDGGVWYPVTHWGVSGFTNARYLCER